MQPAPERCSHLPEWEILETFGSRLQTLTRENHSEAQPQNNQWDAQWITQQLQSYGYQTQYQGKYANILTLPLTNRMWMD